MILNLKINTIFICFFKEIPDSITHTHTHTQRQIKVGVYLRLIFETIFLYIKNKKKDG
jgi:hypothetical protein